MAVRFNMKKITAIEAQKKNPNRVSIFLEDEYAFGLSRLVAAWLKVGQVLSDEKIASLLDEDGREVAMQRALRFLGYRARSEKEMRTYLTENEFSANLIDSTIERLRELELLNDANFARAFIEDRKRFHPRSRRFLSYELKQKGIGEQIANQALQDQVDDSVQALSAARKAAGRYAKLPWQEFQQKLSATLARRGFGYDAIRPAVKQAWDETRESGNETNNEFEEIL